MGKHIRIVGRFDLHTGIGRHGWSVFEALIEHRHMLDLEVVISEADNYEYASQEFLKYKFKNFNLHPSSTEADVTIFCDILGQSNQFEACDSKLNILIFAWDSSRVPIKFVEIMNNDFDIIVAPSNFVKKVLTSSGVVSPVIMLPLIVKNNFEIKQIDSKSKFDKLTFGIIGSLEKRKNIELTIDSFLQSKAKNSKLRVHLTYSHYEQEKLSHFLDKYQNIRSLEISIGELSELEYQNLVNSLDVYVNLSMGEGYSFVPREVMWRGIPQILSNSSAHGDIPKVRGLYFVDCEIAYPAYYPQVDGKQYGIFLGPYPKDVQAIFNLVYDEVKDGGVIFPELNSLVEKWSRKELSSKYFTLVSPKSVIYSDFYSGISGDGTLTLSSDSLVDRYGDLKAETNKITKHVVIANDGGFFSVFNRFVSILVHEKEINNESQILPDWRISSLIDSVGRNEFTSFCYGKETDGNIFFRIFKNTFDVDESLLEQEEFLREGCMLRTDYNEVYEPNLTYIHAFKLYKMANFKDWRHKYNKYFSKYIKLNDRLDSIIKDFVHEKFNGFYLIGAHIRHPSHSIEQPGGRLPTVDVFKEHIDRSLKLAQEVHGDRVKIFVASDQDTVIEYFKEAYGNMLVTTNATRTSESNDQDFASLSSQEQSKEGYQIQHLMASNKDNWSIKMADEVIIDAWLLSHCDEFIHITSNIATAVSFMNPDSKMIYCD